MTNGLIKTISAKKANGLLVMLGFWKGYEPTVVYLMMITSGALYSAPCEGKCWKKLHSPDLPLHFRHIKLWSV